jgi:hypothetical protein
MIKYEATLYAPELSHLNHVDFPTAEEAATHVEQCGKGRVVKFYGEANMPFCTPAIVYKSITMWTLADGKWREHYIHDGHGAAFQESRPQ